MQLQDELDAINRIEAQLGQLRKTIPDRGHELQAQQKGTSLPRSTRAGYELTPRQRAYALAGPVLLLICFYLSQILLPHEIAQTIRGFVTYGQ